MTKTRKTHTMPAIFDPPIRFEEGTHAWPDAPATETRSCLTCGEPIADKAAWERHTCDPD